MSRVEQYRKCAAAGMTIAQTAEMFGVTVQAVRWANRHHGGLGFVDGRLVQSAADERADAIMSLAMAGLPIKAIAHRVSLTGESVRRVLRRHGISVREYSRQRKAREAEALHVHLPGEMLEWVRSQCPEGFKPHEMVTAIVIDAFHEAQESRP